MFIFLSLFKLLTQIDFKSSLCIKEKNGPFLSCMCWKYSFPIYGLSFDLVSGILNQAEVLHEIHLFYTHQQNLA